MSALLVALAGIALAIVCLRAEQTRIAAKTLRLEDRWIRQRRELWALQTSIARLRTPDRIRERVHYEDWFDVDLSPPEYRTGRIGAMLVSDQRRE